jgi:hypothetical protein
VLVLEQSACAQDDDLLAGSEKRLGDCGKEMCWSTFHNEVGDRLELVNFCHRNFDSQLAHHLLRTDGIP